MEKVYLVWESYCGDHPELICIFGDEDRAKKCAEVHPTDMHLNRWVSSQEVLYANL